MPTQVLEMTYERSLAACFFAFVLMVLLVSTAFAEVPSKKQTTLGKYATAKEAYEVWEKSPDSIVILDVRSPEEYAFIGYAPMAHNVPVAFMDRTFDVEHGRYPMKANEHFIEVMKKNFKLDDTIYVMCRSGERSAKAVNLMAENGFINVYNIIDGFEGDAAKEGENAGNAWLMDGKILGILGHIPWTLNWCICRSVRNC